MPSNHDVNIKNSDGTLNIPKWINEDYFKGIVAKDEPDSLAIRKLIPTPAIPPGENFTSIMLRIQMDIEMKDGSLKHKSYIMKTMMADDKGGAIFNNLAHFPKEMKMYNTILPAFENLYMSEGWHIQLAPKCLLAEKRDGRITFVFEDLSQRNFKNINRQKGCDMNHMLSVMRKLAEFHAASIVYEQQHGSYDEDFQYGMLDIRRGAGHVKTAYETIGRNFKQVMGEWNMDQGEECKKKFPSYEQYWKCALASLQPSSNSFNVLCHGDFWSSNIMFSYFPNGEIDKSLLLDFQVCKWASPAMDLLFFLTISAGKEVRVKEFDNFVSIYYARLVECLKLLRYGKRLPTLRALRQDIYDKKNTFYAFFACMSHLPLLMLPPTEDCNLKNYTRLDEEGEQYRLKALRNPLFVEVIRDMYPYYYRQGLFNFEDYD
ncbi:uncharacterized protein LOC106080390 [Stomoxys calcitrans]|uniref:uncharacterized protein LOC106080390 n=1 Tax=Stomoxys calcitrans TaxID=35570 RepID=UPI0027E37F37|nr:uncharacterized protein LOC106080390 [Stomoxys calcitrans]